MNKVKQLLTISLATTAFGLVACGEENSSNPVEVSEESSSSVGTLTLLSDNAVSSSSNNAPNSSSESVIESFGNTMQAKGETVACFEYYSYDNTTRCGGGDIPTRCVNTDFRCDNGKQFLNEREFVSYIANERIINPLFANNCGKVIDICADGIDPVTGEPTGSCKPAGIECPKIQVNASSSLIEDDSSSSIEGESSSSIEGGAEGSQTAGVSCYEHDYYDPEITCIVRCDIRTFRCDDERTFKNELEFGKFVLNERKANPSFASNCGDFEIRCLDDDQGTDNYGGGCDLIGLTCPVTSEPIAKSSSSVKSTEAESSSSSEGEWWMESCNVSGERRTPALDSGKPYPYECLNNRWFRMTILYTNCKPSMEEPFTNCIGSSDWRLEPCENEGEVQDFTLEPSAIKTYKCSNGEWKITGFSPKGVLDCDVESPNSIKAEIDCVDQR